MTAYLIGEAARAARRRSAPYERAVPLSATLERAVADAAAPRSPARSCCSRPRARATTSSGTSSSAARSSGGSYRTSKVKRESARAAPARPRDARPRRLRPGDGLQRDLGVRGARKRRPDLLPQAPGPLRARRASRCARSPRRLTIAGCARSRRRSLVGARALLGRARRSRRRSTARGAGSTAGPLTFQPSELAKLALLHLGRRATSRATAPPRTLGELLKPIGLRHGLFAALILLEPDLGTAIALVLMLAGDADRRRRAGAGARRAPARIAARLGLRRDLARAVPPRALLQLPGPVGTTRRAPASRPCRR